MTNPNGQARRTAFALGLLNGGYSPEEVEDILAGDLPHPDAPTALSDPTNVQLEVINDDAGTCSRPR